MMNQTIRILIVDDEPLARVRMRELLKTNEQVLVVGEAEHGRQAIEFCRTHAVDLLLMDIRMPEMDGLEAAGHLNQLDQAPAIVFCTAYEEHALRAFEAQAVDYLLKPIKRERLMDAINRVQKRMLVVEKPKAAILPKLRARSHLSAKMRGELKLIPIDKVLYLQADTKYVEVHTERETFLIEESLVHLEEEFAEVFVRIHRSILVAQSQIAGLSKTNDSEVTISLKSSPAKLEVSRRNLAAVKKLLREL
jgi:two-component system, LytTR family, response regulator AlgR